MTRLLKEDCNASSVVLLQQVCAAAYGYAEFTCSMVLPDAQNALALHFPLDKSQGSAAQGILPSAFSICHLERKEKKSLRFSVIITGAS